MNNDARISVGLPSHPKTKKLIRRLGPGGAWNLVCLFLWAAQNRPQGDLSGLSDEDIELAAGWDGEDGKFITALVDVRFLDGTVCAREIHGWEEHNPWAFGSDLRSAKAKWNSIKRHHGELEADRIVPEWAAIRNASSKPDSKPTSSASSTATSNAHSKDSAMLQTPNRSAPSPSPSPSLETKSPSGDRPTQEIPFQEILDLYHATMTGLPKVRKLDEGRKRAIRAAWADPERRSVPDFWQPYFEECADDPFYNGAGPYTNGHANWKPDFDFLLRPKTILKVYEKALDRAERAGQ